MNIVDFVCGKNQVKCPRCGARLRRSRLRSGYINRCHRGCGVWIDQQQLNQIVGTKTKRYEVTSDLPARVPEQNTAV